MSDVFDSTMESNIRTTIFTTQLKDLLEDLENKTLVIPRHQRDFVWELLRQIYLVGAMITKKALTGTVLLRVTHDGFRSLEDGRQRLETCSRYVKNKFKVNGKLFSELTDVQRQAFLSYPIPVEQYSGATHVETINIFVQRQGGYPLSTGQKLHAMVDLSPIIRFAIEKLLRKNIGLHNRATAVWGAKDGADPKKTRLLTAVAICCSISHGINLLTKKWGDYQTTEALSKEFDSKKVLDILGKILRIFEEAQSQHTVNGKKKAKQWNPGYVSGYIICDLLNKMPEDHERAIARWVEFVVLARRNAVRDIVAEVLYPKDDKARSWIPKRFENGVTQMYACNFDTIRPGNNEVRAAQVVENEEDENYDDNSEEGADDEDEDNE
jgi:hypothetical protein